MNNTKFKIDIDAEVDAIDLQNVFAMLARYFRDLENDEEPDALFQGDICINPAEETPAIPMIRLTPRFFPNRDMKAEEMILMVAQLIKYSANYVQAKMHLEDSIQSKFVDSNLINKFISTPQHEEHIKMMHAELGVLARQIITRNPHMLGITNEEEGDKKAN